MLKIYFFLKCFVSVLFMFHLINTCFTFSYIKLLSLGYYLYCIILLWSLSHVICFLAAKTSRPTSTVVTSTVTTRVTTRLHKVPTVTRTKLENITRKATKYSSVSQREITTQNNEPVKEASATTVINAITVVISHSPVTTSSEGVVITKEEENFNLG